jgi:hypothetical protein
MLLLCMQCIFFLNKFPDKADIIYEMFGHIIMCIENRYSSQINI